MYKLTLGLVATLGITMVACGDDDHGNHNHADAAAVSCAQETRADPYVAGMEAMGANGYKVVLMTSDPAPPAKGDNVWTLQVMATGDAPVDGATVGVVPFMPDHGHGTPITATVTGTGSNGEYGATPVNLWMPGYWEVTVNIDDGGTTDTAVFKVCIDG